MSPTNKPERDWHDPPSLAAIEGVNPSVMEPQYQEEKFNPSQVPKWYRYIVIGMAYIFIGVAVEVGVILKLPLEELPIVLLSCGVIMFLYGWISRKKGIELKVGE